MLTDIKYVLTFETNSFRNKVICRNFEKPLAGSESDGWHPLVEDFILIARKLEKLGFIHSKGEVVIIDPDEVSHVGR